MNELILTGNKETMTSIDLRELINSARSEFGEPRVRNDQLVSRIEDELDGELGGCKKIAHPQSGAEMKYYDLTLDQCMLVGMRESKSVRRRVLQKLKSLESKNLALPNFNDPIAAAEAWIEAKKAEQLAIATKAEIGSRREATAMNTASQAVKRANKLEIELDKSQEWSTIKRMEIITGLKFNWRLLKSAGKDLGIEPKDVFDPNFGTVKAYHADVWLEAYALDIKQ